MIRTSRRVGKSFTGIGIDVLYYHNTTLSHNWGIMWDQVEKDSVFGCDELGQVTDL